MNTMPTYRKGRRVYRPGERNNYVLTFCSYIFIFILLLVPPLVLVQTELLRYQTYTALTETLGESITELTDGIIPSSSSSKKKKKNKGGSPVVTKDGDDDTLIVHGTSHHILSTTTDPSMNLSIPQTLTLTRHTEYCQWEEIRREECQTCSRTVRARDGSTTEESYDCNCVTSYDYVKSWKKRRINSFLFDQPASHHNPSRDPLPPQTFVSQDAVLRLLGETTTTTTTTQGEEEEDGEPMREEDKEKKNEPDDDRNQNQSTTSSTTTTALLHPQMLEQNPIRGATQRPINWVRNGTPPIPSFFTRWIPDRTRYEDTTYLYQTQPSSPAAQAHQFTYVGNGYFFSPYQPSVYEQLFRGFGQYVEGSLFDWQIGDLISSCTAGDVRVWYSTQDPDTVSVLGRVVVPSNKNKKRLSKVVIEPHTSTNGISIGFVHAGEHTVQEMIHTENNASWWNTFLPRIFLFLWSVPVSRLLGAMVFGRTVSQANRPVVIGTVCAGAIWCGVIGTVWMVVWGGTQMIDSVFVLLGCVGLLWVVYQHPPPKARGVVGWRAGWCMVGRWVGAPPEWRVEESYLKNLDEIKRKDYTAESKRVE